MDKLKYNNVTKLSKIGVSLECFTGKCHYKNIKNIIGLYNETSHYIGFESGRTT